MSAEQNKAAVRRVYEVFSTGDLDVLDELAAPGFVDHNPEPGQEPGAAGVKKAFEEFRAAFPDMRIEVHDMVAEGDKVVARATMTGTNTGPFMGMPATGKSIKAEVIDIVRFENGKAVERWGQYDAIGMMQQLGLAPPMG